MPTLDEVRPEDLQRRLAGGEQLIILDVREPGEVAVAAFPGAIHIPMGDISSRIAELDPERETVVVCHHGIRSAQVAGYLVRMGFERVLNLAGGIDAWSLLADPGVARY
jgi:rhodanese-related sulfurtransferase